MRFPIHIKLHRSRLLLFLLLLFHALAGGSAFFLPWHGGGRFLLLALIGLSAWRTLRPSAVVGLRLAQSGAMECVLRNGDRTACVILPDSAVFSGLVVLRVRLGDASRPSSLALLRDSMSADQFRVLRLWLRWRAVSSESVVPRV